MSPSNLLEPTYERIKERLMVGEWRPGHRLDTRQLATELGVSASPVRDSLNRLAGERMVEFHAGLGFHVPRIDEFQLRDLLNFNLHLLLITAVSGSNFQLEPVVDTATTDSAQVFYRLAQCAGNGEITAAIDKISDRLAPTRRLESRVLAEPNATIQELVHAVAAKATWPTLARILIDYHKERKACIAKFVRLLDEGHE